MVRGICCILLAIAIFAPLARKIYKWNRVSDEQVLALHEGLVDPWSCAPEPAERTTYLVGSLLAPVLLLGLTLASRRLERRLGTPPVWLERCLQVGLCACIFAYAWWLLAGDEYFLLGANLFYEHPWAAVPALMLIVPALVWFNGPAAPARWSARLLVATSIVALFLVNWLGKNDAYYAGTNHFAAFYDPVVQVSLGKDLLSDYATQYGLYADFLAPLFAVIGLSVTKFTFVLGLLCAASFGLLWWVLSQAIERRGIAVLGFLGLLFNVWMMFQVRTLAYHPDFFDPYYQYLPLRILFPALSIALVWGYQRRPSRSVYWGAQSLLAVGILWNSDSGLVALGAWLAALGFDALYERSWWQRGRLIAGHAAAALATTTLVIATYAGIKFACYGAWPAFGHLFDYQRLFYLSGFYMLPMHFQGAWQLVVIVYLAGVAQSAAALAAGRQSPRQTLVFMISLMGLGLFSYYQGRSHDLCLILCWWPAVLLLPIFLDELLDRQEQTSPLLAYGLAGMIGWFLIGSAASFGVQIPALSQMTAEQIATDASNGPRYAAEAQMLRERVAPDEGVLVLSAYAPVLETQAQRSTLAPAALVQMLWVSQYESLLDSLEQRPRSWIFVDRDYDKQFFLSPKTNPGSKLLMDAIRPRLRKVAETNGGALYEFLGACVTAQADNRQGATSPSDGANMFTLSAAASPFVRGLPR